MVAVGTVVSDNLRLVWLKNLIIWTNMMFKEYDKYNVQRIGQI